MRGRQGSAFPAGYPAAPGTASYGPTGLNYG